MTTRVHSQRSTPKPKTEPKAGPKTEPKAAPKANEVKAATVARDGFGTAPKQGAGPAELPKEVQAALDALPPETVKPEDVKALQERLGKMDPAAREAEVKFLREQVLNQANAGRALSTYVELKNLQDVKPERLTDALVHTLTRGVAEARTTGAAGSEGVLGKQQALDAANALMRMGDTDYQALQGALEAAGKKDGEAVPGADAQAEQALLLKAVAARKDELVKPSAADKARLNVGQPSEPMVDVLSYGAQVAGLPRQELIEQSTVLDLDAGSGALQQRFTMSCVPTSQQTARAEADPVYARRLHQEAIHSLEEDSDIGREQKEWLEQGGGVAVPRDPEGPGGVGMMPEAIINDFLGPYTNKTYTANFLADTAADRGAALDRAETLLRDGEDVPIGVYWDGGGGHAMLLTDVRGTGDDREFLLTDPWHGQTAWVSAKDMESGHTDFLAGTGRLAITYE